MTTFNEDKLRFMGDEEDEYLYVVVNHTNKDKEYNFIDTFDEAVKYYNTIHKGQYLKLYKIGYKWYDAIMKNKQNKNSVFECCGICSECYNTLANFGGENDGECYNHKCKTYNDTIW